MTESDGDIQAAVDAGRLSTDPHPLALGRYHVVATRDGVHEVDLTGDRHQPAPRRIIRQVTVNDTASFLEYFLRHAVTSSEVFADRDSRRITAILDAPGPGQPSWCDHRLTMQLEHTTAWRAWTGKDREYMWQAAFAEHLEDNLADIVDPPGAEMLEVAQTLQATTKVSFASGYRLVNGQRQIQYTEETTGSAGARGTLQIPAEFRLGLPVFRGDDAAEQVTARLRYRVKDAALTLGYALDRPEEAVERAFETYVAAIGSELATPVLRGHAAAVGAINP